MSFAQVRNIWNKPATLSNHEVGRRGVRRHSSFLRALGGTIKETNFRLGKDTGAKVLFEHVKGFLVVGKLAKDNLVGIRDKMFKEAKERLCLRDKFLVTTASCRGVRTVLDLGEGEHVEGEPSWGQGDV